MSTESHVSAEMPRYKCHKEVHALKIAKIELRPLDHGGKATITPADEGFAPFDVDWAFVEKHEPQEGGYYIVYADGYKSFSPAEPFEAGYTRMP